MISSSDKQISAPAARSGPDACDSGILFVAGVSKSVDLVDMRQQAAEMVPPQRSLSHKSCHGRGGPFPGQTYPNARVTGMPSAV